MLEPAQVEAMQRCWNDFYKTVLGPQQVREDRLHPAACSMFECKHPWDDRFKKKYEEMWQWEDFVIRHYRAPQLKNSGVEAILTCAILAILAIK